MAASSSGSDPTRRAGADAGRPADVPARGGLVFLSASCGHPFFAATAYLALEGLVMLVCLGLAWRGRRTSPEMPLGDLRVERAA